MASSSGNVTSNIPKWWLAVALGAGATGIGLGYWYMKRQENAHKKGSFDKSVSIDDSESNVVPIETPTEKALRFKNDGNNMFKIGKYDEAIAQYNKAIEACPEAQKIDLATYYHNRAAAYEKLKKWSAVIADCTKAIELNPKYEKALFRRAKACEVTKDLTMCLDDITTVCLLASFNNQNALIMADRVLKELGKLHASEAMATRKPILPSKYFINSYFSSFSEDVVYNTISTAGEPMGDGPLKGFLRAKMAYALENYGDIIPACTEEITSSEAESRFLIEALALRASFHLLMAAHKEGLEDLDAVINNEEAPIKIRVNCLIKRASLKFQLEDRDGCLEDFKFAVKLGPEISDVYHHRGQVNLLMENTEEARDDFNKAVSLNPNFAIAVVQKCYADYRYGVTKCDVDLLMKNAEDFAKAVERFPSCTEVYVLQAQVLSERQEFDKSEQMYMKAQEIEPGNARILVHRAMLLLSSKCDIDGAVALIKEAISLDDKCEFAYETLGTVEVQRGNVLVAVDLFDKAIALARTETEMAHLFSLRDAAISQQRITTKYGIGPQVLA